MSSSPFVQTFQLLCLWTVCIGWWFYVLDTLDLANILFDVNCGTLSKVIYWGRPKVLKNAQNTSIVLLLVVDFIRNNHFEKTSTITRNVKPLNQQSSIKMQLHGIYGHDQGCTVDKAGLFRTFWHHDLWLFHCTTTPKYSSILSSPVFNIFIPLIY